ncbi:hypothetical protein FN846DRAFT_998399, partial [Sphaerosporella brunnea]
QKIEEWESWERPKAHRVPLQLFMGKKTGGIQAMGQLIEAENLGVSVPMAVRWLGSPTKIKERYQKGEIKSSSIVFSVKRKATANRLILQGVRAAGILFQVECCIPGGPDSIRSICSHWGHIADRCPQPKMPVGALCSKHHLTEERMCGLESCAECVKCPGRICKNTTVKCPNCKGDQPATSRFCE